MLVGFCLAVTHGILSYVENCRVVVRCVSQFSKIDRFCRKKFPITCFSFFIFILERDPESKQEVPKEIPNSSKITDVGQTHKHKSTLTPKQSAPTSCQQVGSTPSQQTKATPTQHTDTTPTQSHSHTEAKSK